MRRASVCPVCEGRETRVEWTDRTHDCLTEVRTCECGAEFVNYYEVTDWEVTHDPTDGDE